MLMFLLNHKQKLGILDITFYRDDFSRAGIQPTVKPSKLPLGINDKHIVLVDDVLHTGRTVRAALNEIFDFSFFNFSTLLYFFFIFSNTSSESINGILHSTYSPALSNFF